MTLSRGRDILAIPGPSIIPDRVLNAMHRPAPNIYEGELLAITDTILADLGRVAGTKGRVAVYIGNGHAGWEAAIANLLGDLWTGDAPPDFAAALREDPVRLHLYGKVSARPGRKMGHLSAVAAGTDEALRLVLDAREAMRRR